MTNETKIIWVISDGKRGHINQSLGLAEALQRRQKGIELEIIPTSTLWKIWNLALQTRQKETKPALIIGAGHSTHFSLLVLAKIMRVPCIVLMKPSLPLSWFDLCIIPEHDLPPKQKNIIRSIGAINRVQPAKKEQNTGLILIGGPSKHVGWDDDKLLIQINDLIHKYPYHWIVTTSRRTPIETVEKLHSNMHLEVIPYTKTDIDWLPMMLAKTQTCYVTEDSVSMIYEALTAGCELGLLHLPMKNTHHTKVSLGIKQLQHSGYIKTDGLNTIDMPPLAEASRCAALVQQRFL